VIWVGGEAEYFSQEGWTEKSEGRVICPSGKSLEKHEGVFKYRCLLLRDASLLAMLLRTRV
jgi:hypothetical protein